MSFSNTVMGYTFSVFLLGCVLLSALSFVILSFEMEF